MATRTYYGTCKTGSGVSQKKVYVPDEDLNTNFQFIKGDLLVVFFSQTNTVISPSIVVYNQDPELETSTTSDSGKLIKTLDVQSNLQNAWAAGETVIFAYTKQGTSNTYYWELVDANHASVQTYGDTKLFDVKENFQTWIAGEEDDADSTVALTPNMLKRLFNLMVSENEEEEAPIGLKWSPGMSGTAQRLGTLSLTNGTKGVPITYPIEQKIANYIAQHNPVTRTSQLDNDGEGTNPFITKIPGNLYFGSNQGLYYGTTPSTAKFRINLNYSDNNNNKIVIGQTSDTSLAGITLGKPTAIIGNTNVTGTINTTGKITATVGSGAGLSTNGIIQEKGQDLSARYSPKLQVVKFTDQVGKIAKGKTSTRNNNTHLHIPVNKSGWTPIGVVGYNVNYLPPHKTGDALFANVWECYLKTISGVPNVEYSIYNLHDKDIYVQIDVYVLYTQII